MQMKMFKTSSLIKEVMKKRSLWDNTKEKPTERCVRVEEWLEVAESLFPNWHELNTHDQRKRLDAIKRKWTNVRDYYKKVVQKRKGRQYMYSHLLDFLREKFSADENRSSTLIKEIMKKPSVWDTTQKKPTERKLRAKEWLEIAEAMFPNWNELNAHDKREKIKAMKRRWTNIRDYYKKGVKKWKGRKYVYSHLLDDFLGEKYAKEESSTSSKQTKEKKKKKQAEEMDIPSPIRLQICEGQNVEITPIESTCEIENIPIQEFIISEQFSAEESKVILSDPSTAAQTCLQNSPETDNDNNECEYDSDPSLQKRCQDNEEYMDTDRSLKKRCQDNDECMDADRCFLLSLLPEMRNMTALQKVTFKISMLKELSVIMREKQNFVIKEEPFS